MYDKYIKLGVTIFKDQQTNKNEMEETSSRILECETRTGERYVGTYIV